MKSMNTDTKTTDDDLHSESGGGEKPRKGFGHHRRQDGSKPWPVDRSAQHHHDNTLWGFLADLYNSLSYSYMKPILEKGKNQFISGEHLDIQDLFEVPAHMASAVLVERFR